MNWLLVALINPLAHALVNHIDKYLISRFMKGGSVGTLVLFSSLFSIIALPIIYFIHPNVFETITLFRAVVLMLNGAVLVAAIIFYLYALADDEASYVAPLFQLVPILSFILGFFILGETLTGSQIWAALLILMGSFLLSLELKGKKTSVKLKLLLLMTGSSTCYALSAIIFKLIAVEQGFLDSLFWDLAGKFVFGLILFVSIRSYHEQFIALIKSNRFSIIGLNIVNEIIALIGEVSLVLAVLYAPVVLVQSVAGIQPAFVFLIGIFLTLFFPRFAKESIDVKSLLQKALGIIIISLGIFYIY